ncbi:PLD nuclease N-terminal domain-containing protein [Roseobacter sp. HKCCA0434]|uniref:PLD nuclease N-terminal domain-containing protein n=1 Tax=Roseobacter sp. HKCCA0434 TaxID=3079297 RepID=UPI002905F411|nr:PLD nuclease N-terminal domain-containing protein [Roseobacter sp. HKCCA0434]
MEFILGIIHLVLIIWALLNIFKSGASTGAKILWALGVIIFPIIGFIVWFFAGPKSAAV